MKVPDWVMYEGEFINVEQVTWAKKLDDVTLEYALSGGGENRHIARGPIARMLFCALLTHGAGVADA